jgi:hypothetical protein
MRRRTAIAIGLVLASGAAFAALRGRDGASAGDAHAVGDAGTLASSREAAHRYLLGSELTYTIGYASDGTMEVASGGAARLSSRFHARLVRTVVADAEHGAHLVLYRFLDADVTVSVNESIAPGAASDVAAWLGAGVLAEEAPDGHVLSMRAPVAAPALALSFARTLLAGLQVTLPLRRVPAWNARESDANGDYVATYVVVGDRTPVTGALALKKTKRPSRASVSAATLGSGAEQGPWSALASGESRTTGATEIDFDLDHGAMKELASEETVESTLGALQVATTKTKLDAERTAERTLDAPALAALLASIAALRAAEPASLSARSNMDVAQTKTNASKRWLGTTTLPELVTALHASEGRTHDERHFDLFLKLHALTYLHPDACARVAQLLAPLDPSGSSFQVALAALGATGSKEAQAALIAALHVPSSSTQAKKQIIATLGMMPMPSEEAEAALRAVRDARDASSRPELAATASMSLGIMARSLASRAPQRASTIVDEALARALADEHDEPRLLLDLAILGNTGSPRILHHVLRWTHATSAEERGQAAFALRFVRADEAEARLLEIVAADDDAALRSRTATALSYRDGTARSLEVQAARASADPDPGVRAALLGNLFAMRELYPEALAVLEERRRIDPDAKVKQVADSLIGSTARE